MYFYWEKGRTLSGVEMNGGEGYTAYITNSDGIRINKNVMWFSGSSPFANYAYEYNGTQLISQKWGIGKEYYWEANYEYKTKWE